MLPITKFNDSDYLAVLLFRQKVYDLKPKLYRLVERVFGQYPWWNEMNTFLGRGCFPESNRQQVDVSNLLRLVRTNNWLSDTFKMNLFTKNLSAIRVQRNLM